jgi:hypothetical protein
LLVLESRWTDWFTDRPAVMVGQQQHQQQHQQRCFRDSQREQWFMLAMDRIVSRIALQSNIDDLRFVLNGLTQLDKKLKMFEFDTFIVRYKADVMRRLVLLIVSQEREMVLDELTDLAWELVSRDLSWFFSQVQEQFRILFVVDDGMNQSKVEKQSFKDGLVAWCEVVGVGG